MEFYRIRTENDVRVYKKTGIPMLILMLSAILLVWAGIATACGIHWHGQYELRDAEYRRVVDESGLRAEQYRERTELFEGVISSAREEISDARKSLLRTSQTLDDIRSITRELKRRFDTLEDILNSVGNNDGGVRNSHSGSDSDNH